VPVRLDVIAGWSIVLSGLAAVAAAAAGLMKRFVYPDNPIPRDRRLELEEKYGHWAVETAIAVCPHDDIRCIEREARRLYQVRLHRR
jgi:hypothetical protein